MLILYLIEVKPYNESFMNMMEVFNEFTILFLIYLTWCFSDLLDSVEVKWTVGFLYSGIIFFSLAANVIALSFKTL